MNRKTVLTVALGFLFLAIFATQAVTSVRAETGTGSTLEPPALPEAPGLSKWFVDGNGTVFQITNSSYLNVTLTSSEPVHVFLESVPRMISFHVEGNGSATSTVLTFTGFEPSTTYYRHQDGFLIEGFTTDSSGGYAYTQDISELHHVYIQEYVSTQYISSDYTFTSDINEPIVVTADNIVIDGNGYTLQGPGSGYGFYLYGRSGVTIKNVIVKGWTFGIFLVWPSSGNTISGNTLTSNAYYGICLSGSDCNTISGNTLTSNAYYGIYLSGSGNTISGNTITSNAYYGIYLSGSGNTISGNTITSSTYGIYLSGSGNTISGNTLTSNAYYGIYLWFASSGNTISGNTITNNFNGMGLASSSGNTISGNTLTSNNVGIYLYGSGGNILRNNVMTGNDFNFGVFGSKLADFIQDIDTSNTVDGKPIYYLINQDTLTINLSTYPNIGYLALVNSTNIIVEELELKNNGQGILLANTTKSVIIHNTLTSNTYGIYLYGSGCNSISGNTVTSNTYYGIYMWESSCGNTISGNNITNNRVGIYLRESSCGNTISGNNITNNNAYGILLYPPSCGNTISSNTITYNGVGIYMWASSGNTISSNTITNNNNGICLDGSSSGNTISGNTIINNGVVGIFLGSSGGNTILGNTITNNGHYGIELLSSSGNTISSNTITNNYLGIDLIYGSGGNTISSNTITYNGVGIYPWASSGNTISGNTITNNLYGGIYLGGSSSGNTISGNTITNNSRFGIYLFASCSGNTIYHNNFIDNKVQAYDENPATNHWHNLTLLEGNYWSDYPGVDNGGGTGKHAIPGDGIGDTNIPWPTTDYDYYPFTTKSGWEKIQYQITFDQLGVSSDFAGTVVIIDSVNYSVSDLPVSFRWDKDSTHTFAFQSPLVVTSNVKQYAWTSTTGLSTQQRQTITITASGTVIGNYKTQYYLTVVSTHGTPGGMGWYDKGEPAYATVTPLIVPGATGVQYVFTHWSGDASGTTSPSDMITMDAHKTAIANYKTQYYLTVISRYDTPGGEGWYDDSETAYAALLVGLDYVNEVPYGFVGWTGDASGLDLTSNPITMHAPKTATAKWEASTVYGADYVKTIGFWRRNVRVWYLWELHLTGAKTSAGWNAYTDMTEDELLAYLRFIDNYSDYFGGKIVKDNNGDGTITNLEILENAYNFVKPPQGAGEKTPFLKAEEQLFLVWLNLSRKAFFWNTQLSQETLYVYSQYNFENEYGLTTIGEAIKFCEAQLLKPDGDYEAARSICQSINETQGIIWGT